MAGDSRRQAAEVVRRGLLLVYCFAVAATLQLGLDLVLHSPSQLRSLLPASSVYQAVLVIVLVAGALFAAWRLRAIYASRGTSRFRSWIQGFSDRSWCVTSIAVGVALRLLWCLVFPPQQASDGAVYFELAGKLAHGDAYFIPGPLGGYAFWPPGLPLLLAPLVALFGNGRYLPLALNLMLFAGGTLALYALGKRWIGIVAARVAVALTAAWPGYVFASGLAGKELILVALLPTAVLLHWRGMGAAQYRPYPDLGSGALFGFCALTQPASVLMPLTLVGVDFLQGVTGKRVVRSLVWLLVGAALVVGPWTTRNYLVLGQFVPISTNAAMTMYAGNHAGALGNAAATGGYVTPPLLDWRSHDELERANAYREATRHWIAENPLDFAQLTLKRLELILGDDSDGVYRALALGLGEHSTVYFSLKMLSNAFWLLLIVASLPVLMTVRGAQGAPQALLLPGAFLLYSVAVHAFVEGGSRHHMGTLWCYALIMGYAVAQPERPG